MTGGRFTLWLMIVVAFSLTGMVTGQFFDWLFWHISFDYIYRSHQFLSGATRLGLLLGSVVAASATVGFAPVLPRRVVLPMVASTAISGGTFGLCASLIGVAIVKWATRDLAPDLLAPRTRVWFCDLLWQGTLIGTVLASCVWICRSMQNRWHRP